MGKKYHNPINKPMMVQIPKWEYSLLVERSTKLNVIEALILKGDSYGAISILEMLTGVEKEAEG